MEQRISELEQAMIQLALAQAKTEVQIAKTEAQVKITSKIVSGIGINLGNATEQIFYEALKSKMALGAIKFDSIHENVSVKRKNLHPEASGEFDTYLQWNFSRYH